MAYRSLKGCKGQEHAIESAAVARRGSSALMGPCDRAKAGLLEAQSPGEVKMCFLRKSRLIPVPVLSRFHSRFGATFGTVNDAQ
jgi:hypothetical protein